MSRERGPDVACRRKAGRGHVRWVWAVSWALEDAIKDTCAPPESFWGGTVKDICVPSPPEALGVSLTRRAPARLGTGSCTALPGPSGSWRRGLPSQPRPRPRRGESGARGSLAEMTPAPSTGPSREPATPCVPSQTALSWCDRTLHIRAQRGARPPSRSLHCPQSSHMPCVVCGAGGRLPSSAPPSAAEGESGQKIYPFQNCRLSSRYPLNPLLIHS